MTTKEYILNTILTHKAALLNLGIEHVGLFGSYVRNEQSGDSDIDILIEFDPKKENFDNFMAVYDYLEKIFHDEKVDIVTKNGLSPYIGPEILNEVVYV
jgi:uncharacterized protein